jgi:hypothetical protein
LFQRKSRDYMAMPAQRPRARFDDLVIEEVDDELLVYDSANKRAHCLGATAARVWRACDGHTDVSALSEALELNAEVVRQALDELEALELLDTEGLKVVQTGNGNGLTRRQLASRSARVGAGLAAAPLVYSIAVPSASALATPTNLACALFSTNSCGVSSGAGAVSGCCCCCQGGGDCKIGGATSTCAMGPTCPDGSAPMCSSSCNPNQCDEDVNSAGCCGVAGSDGCGCAFAGGTDNQDGCLCNDTSGQCNDNPQTGCANNCTPGAVNCGAGCCSTTGCTAGPGGTLINCPGCAPGATDCVPCCNGSPISQTGTVPFNCCVPGGASTCPQQVF